MRDTVCEALASSPYLYEMNNKQSEFQFRFLTQNDIDYLPLGKNTLSRKSNVEATLHLQICILLFISLDEVQYLIGPK